jgi:hypothetical protein
MSSSRVTWLVLLGAGCTSAPAPARAPDEIGRVEVVPAGHVALGGARASCGGAPSWGRLDAEPLTRFECDPPTLERALAEQAAARGGSLLAGMRCQTIGAGLTCSATIAAPDQGTAPLVAGPRARPVAPDTLTFETARTIEVDVEPQTPSFRRRARGPDDVGVQLTVPVSHLPLGSLVVRCDEKSCDHDDLRVALRVAAGALGVSDVAGVACGVRRGDPFCAATLAASELDAETDPRAR